MPSRTEPVGPSGYHVAHEVEIDIPISTGARASKAILDRRIVARTIRRVAARVVALG